MKTKLLIASIITIVTASCTKAQQQPAAQPEEPESRLELPLPIVPANITDQDDRAAYILHHFWDSLDFADTVRSLNNDVIEQNFSNFVSLFTIADDEVCADAVNTLMRKASVEPKAYRLLISTAAKYLYEPNSPMFDEHYYALFVNAALSSNAIGYADRERLSTERVWINKNRIGTTATDFKYRTRNGNVTTLLKTPISGQMLLLLYDPTCDHCQEILKNYSENDGLNQHIADGSLTVLAVNIMSDEKPYAIPDNWISGTDLSNIEDNELYILRASPTIYVLNAAHTIVAKDIQPDAVLQ